MSARNRLRNGSAPKEAWRSLEMPEAARLSVSEALSRLETAGGGLTPDEASQRLATVGPNAVRSHGAQLLGILVRQLKSLLLLLLVAAAVTSLIVGETTDAGIILGIISLSVGLGFVNEYRAAKAVEALHSRIRHTAVVIRGGETVSEDVTKLVPGDVVRLDVGDIVPADMRLLEANGLECDEAVLTGESEPAEKRVEPVATPGSPLELPCCAFMGTVVRNGTGAGVIVRTGQHTEFGKIAMRLGETQEETAFQIGLRDFSGLLIQVTSVLCVSIFVINTALQRPILESALFALAIAVGLTPQLLPAIVTISLSTGARRLAHKSVIVKRLVSIEDLGNIEVLFTDKTGTLTQGELSFSGAVDAGGQPSQEVFTLGLACNSAAVQNGVAVGGNALDRALWASPDAAPSRVAGYKRIAEAPFDYDRRLMSVLVETPDGRRLIIAKGAPESVFERCANASPQAHALLDSYFASGSRVVAVATRDAADLSSIKPVDEANLQLAGLLIFVDPLKPSAAASLMRLKRLGVEVKIVTGDNERVGQKVCGDLDIGVMGTLTGAAIETMDDAELSRRLPETTIFARVSPEQKSRIIRTQRALHTTVGFMGDGVNDAVALHDADVGISVNSAADVAKDAADIVLTESDLDILADGVVEGRRIFSNTIKYVLMGTSSNFGNMFSAAGASLVLSFLPMLPPQILLNNLLYDISELTIPTDNVDEELLARPARWDTGFIRRFMIFFGPISSIYDFMTFGVMIWVFDASEKEFHSAWFVESLCTQTLVIFVIRTRRVPFFRSKPSLPLLLTTLACVASAIALPFSPLAGVMDFTSLPAGFMGILALMVITYLGLVELGKARFFRPGPPVEPLAKPKPARERRVHRVASRWSLPRLPGRRRLTQLNRSGRPSRGRRPAGTRPR